MRGKYVFGCVCATRRVQAVLGDDLLRYSTTLFNRGQLFERVMSNK